MIRLLVTANVVPSSPILVTLMMKALRSSETSILARATRRNISEADLLYLYLYHCSVISVLILTGSCCCRLQKYAAGTVPEFIEVVRSEDTSNIDIYQRKKYI
jgi:hypothetical protein